jgi:hypothetical protein
MFSKKKVILENVPADSDKQALQRSRNLRRMMREICDIK